MKKIIKLYVSFISTLFSLTGCTPTVSVWPELVWPDPPDQARIEFVEILQDQYFQGQSYQDKLSTIVFGAEAGQKLIQAFDVATDARGNVYVSDSADRSIKVFDREQGKIRKIGQQGKTKLLWPVGLAIHDSLIWVADSYLQKIVCMTTNGKFIKLIGKKGELNRPGGLAYHAGTDRLYVTDSNSHQIIVFNAHSGDQLFTIGARGSGEGEFNFPSYMSIKNDKIYVVDAMNFRVQIFDLDGNFISKFGQAGDAPGDLYRPKGLAVTNDEYIFVTDGMYHNFQIFDEAGNVYLFVGIPGTAAGEFHTPMGIHIDENNLIYVVDQHNSRVQVFRFLGAG
ncbi:MAG: 6-bladed beta-propeller [Candidatus Marinimicrobia bacterium]|nr:6-bladed beta-propeller [Candidatus Neomarinimicrobiota bacterium]